MRHIGSDEAARLAKPDKAARVDELVVVPESGAALAYDDARVARGAHLVRGRRHRCRAAPLPLLDVHDSTRAGRRREQVGLSAEESRDLQYIHHLSCQSRLCRFVHIAEHGYTDSLAHGAQRVQPAIKAGPAVAAS